MKLPKYISLRSGTYHYQRDYPTKLKHLCHTKAYTKPLGLFANNATATEITKAALEAGEAYDRQLTLISSSDPDALSATDKDKAVIEFLRRRGLRKGQYLRVKKDAAISMQEQKMADEVRSLLTDGGIERAAAEDLSYQSFTDEALHADWAIPEMDDVENKQARGQKLTLQDQIVGDAWLSLVNKQEAKPKTLGGLWAEYVSDRSIDVNSRKGKKYVNYWKQWIAIAGDCIIGPLSQAHIREGLADYAKDRAGKVSSSSIERELSPVMACLRLGSEVYGFDWNLKLPRIKKTEPNHRHPLEPDHQLELIKSVLTEDGIKPMYGVTLLLCLQGGMMVSEIARLRPEDIALDAVLPHLVIRNKTKNEDRKRIVPIVLGLELIKEHLGSTVRWLKNTTESGPSATLKKIMRRTIDSPNTSAHCLRHTFKINGQNAGVSVLTLASIAGWADPHRKASKHLLNYGSTGISKEATVIKLRDDSIIIHQELIALEDSLRSDSNVLVFAAQGT
jgi:integrase